MAFMVSVDSLMQNAARVLTATIGRTVDLVDAMELESDSTVIRATVVPPAGDQPATVIVKRVTDQRLDLPGHDGPPSRFLNEWAALEFLTDIEADVAPKLVAADRSQGLTIVEDIGDHPTLESRLFGENSESAMEGLATAGRLLGRLHAMSRDRESEFAATQMRLGTMSPSSDSTIDQRGRQPEFLSILEVSGIERGESFGDQIVELESLIHDDSPFRSLIHADAGPHNVLVAGDDSCLLDFEFAVYRNVLCDAVGPRLGFPQTTGVGWVPTDAVDTFEHSYRRAVVLGIPPAEDDSEFSRHLTAACGHWALNRWVHAWRDHLSRLGASPPGIGAIEAIKGVWMVIDGFVDASRRFGEFEVVADALGRFREEEVRRWPELEPAPVYPALRNL